jgi:hypothetical protein
MPIKNEKGIYPWLRGRVPDGFWKLDITKKVIWNETNEIPQKFYDFIVAQGLTPEISKQELVDQLTQDGTFEKLKYIKG